MTKANEKNQTVQQQTGQNRPESGLSNQNNQGKLNRPGWTYPSLFSISPRDFFTANPFEMMRRFSDEMDRVFSSGVTGGSQRLNWSPAIEVVEQDNQLVVRAALPGLNQDDVKVEVTDDGLVIYGEHKREHSGEQSGVHRSEFSYGSFYRQIPLPENINPDQIEAQFQNGMLTVTVPITEKRSNRREVQIGGTKQKQVATGATGSTSTTK